MATVIKCIVADKKVVDVLRMLKDFCLDPPVVEPMDDISASLPKKKPGFSVTNKIYAMVNDAIKRGDNVITSKQFAEIAKNSGGHPTGYSYAIKKLMDNKRLKRGKAPNTYEVLK